MEPPTFSQRLRLYLYSANNIAGSLLAMGGLGMYFAGVFHAHWMAIIAGLYGAGALGWPRSDLARTAERTELSTEMLAQQIHKLVDSVAKGLPNEAVDVLRSIEATLAELLPRLQEMQDRGVISAKQAFTVHETVQRYLPDTLAAYLRLPRLYAQRQVLADGHTAAQALVEQLKVLDSSLKDITNSAFTGDAEALIANGQFLQSRFAEKTVFLP